MACAHQQRNCAVGLILGTGTNACYIEQLELAEMAAEGNYGPGCSTPGPGGITQADAHMIINTEWGAFGNDGCLDFIITDFDRQVIN